MIKRLAALAVTAAIALPAGIAPVGASSPDDNTYDLPAAGVLLEGIGYDDDADVIYVSGVNDGGRIYRAEVGSGRLAIWQPGNTDGRTTARGIDVDEDGNVFVAGGPSGKAFVYASSGALLAVLSTPDGTFLNDVWIGKDDAAYITNSNSPQIFRIAQEGGRWSIELWLDASDTIPVTIGAGQFNLGGIVESQNGRYLLVAQGNAGKLWRVDVRTKVVAEVDLGGASITNADGIVLKGRTLYVVRNFARKLTAIRLSENLLRGTVTGEISTSADRTFTTAKLVEGELLAVDSQFGLPAPFEAEARVVPLDRP